MFDHDDTGQSEPNKARTGSEIDAPLTQAAFRSCSLGLQIFGLFPFHPEWR
jgi:hypothetical protein